MTDLTRAAAQEITLLAVREIMADCAGVELEQVTPSASFIDDLGGESIDIIDLAFRLEKTFRVKAPLKILNNDQLWERDSSGKLTAAAQALMQQKLPFLDIQQLQPATGSFSATTLLTAEFLFQLLKHTSAEQHGN